MNAKRSVIAILFAAMAFPLFAAQPPTQTDDAVTPAEIPDRVADAQPPQEDRWTVPASVSPPAVADSVDRADAVFDAAPKRPALTFADQQPLKPNLFDSPTAWEDEP